MAELPSSTRHHCGSFDRFVYFDYVQVMTTPTSTMPSPETAKSAETALRLLAPLKRRATRSVRLRVANAADEVVLPREAFELLLRVLAAMADGNAVTVVPVTTELTTQQAAGVLQVSRPYLVQLLDGGQIPFRMVGTHRRVLARDVLKYREETRAASESAMEELAAVAQKHGLGY